MDVDLSLPASVPFFFLFLFLFCVHLVQQIKRLIPVIESAGYVVIPNWSSTCVRDCELYRVLHQSPEHLHQTTVDIFLQHRDDEKVHPFNDTATFMHRPARVPHNAAAYLDARYPGWRDTQVLTVENWLPDPVTGKKPPWLMSSLLKVRRPFNRSMETITVPPWAHALHAYAEWDLEHAGIDRRDERTPKVEIVWRPEQMGQMHGEGQTDGRQRSSDRF